jgi:hypothetical protein
MITALSVERRAMGWMARVRFPAVLDFSFLHSLQIDPGAHPASYPMGVGGFFHRRLSGMAVKLTTQLDLVPRSRKEELYSHSAVCLHGIMLSN